MQVLLVIASAQTFGNQDSRENSTAVPGQQRDSCLPDEDRIGSTRLDSNRPHPKIAHAPAFSAQLSPYNCKLNYSNLAFPHVS